MSVQILNREFQHPADGWYQIESKGFHPAIAANGDKVVQVVDNQAIKSIVNGFNADAAAGTLPNGHEMLIDHEHFRHDQQKETIAYGWAGKLRASPDGSGFDVFNPWTDTGKRATDGGDYRFFSTEYHGGADVLEPVSASQIPVEVRNKYAGYTFLRPLKLTGLSLTNCNNNKGQKAITITNRFVPLMPASKAAPGIPKPELLAWFRAVGTLQMACGNAAAQPMNFQDAWEICRQQHPDLYAAAFGGDTVCVADTDLDAEADHKAAVNEVADLANRVQSAAGSNFLFAWNFVRDNLPHIFNRQLPKRQALVNRVKASIDPRHAQAQAAKLFNRLALAEQFATRAAFSTCWGIIANREPALNKLASGRCTPEEAFAVAPHLRELIEA